MMFWELIRDALLAAVAAVGFGAVSDPPKRAFLRIAVLAAVGHALRFYMMNYCGYDIVTSSFIAAFIIGLGAVWVGKHIYCPSSVLFIPALLPMIPGMYAYRTVYAMILFVQNLSNPDVQDLYLNMLFYNGLVTCGVVFMLGVGGTLPMVIFSRRAFTMTRHDSNH